MFMRTRNSSETRQWPKTPALLKYRSSKWFILATVCVAAFSDAFIYAVVIPVFPHSLREIYDVSEDDVQFWNSILLAAFGGAQFVGSPLFGWLADQTSSRQMPLLLGFISNAAATALLYSARTVWGLALSRFLQGLSAAVVYSVGFAILADTVGSKDIGQWIGYVLASVNLGMTVSPTLGGILYEKTGYLSIFIVMFGLIAVDILQRSFMVEKKVAMKWQIAAAAKQQEFLRQYATLQRDPSQHTHGEQANESTPLLQSESVSESECESEETESEDQAEDQRSNHSSSRIADCIDDHIEMLDKGWKTPPLMILLGSPRVLANLYGVWVYVTVLVSFDSALPIFVERTFGWGSTGGGLIFLTITIPIFCAPLAGRLSDLYDSRWISVTGFILAGLFTTLLLLVSHDGTPQVALFCSLLTLFGFAKVLGSSPLGVDLTRAVESMELDQPGIFGSGGAYAQVFALFTSATAGGVLAGPVWTSFAYGKLSWTFLVVSLGVLNASVAIPVFFFAGSKERHRGSTIPASV